jgi:hypothetical protein
MQNLKIDVIWGTLSCETPSTTENCSFAQNQIVSFIVIRLVSLFCDLCAIEVKHDQREQK